MELTLTHQSRQSRFHCRAFLPSSRLTLVWSVNLLGVHSFAKTSWIRSSQRSWQTWYDSVMAPSRSLIKILIVWMRGLSAPWWRVASKLNKCVMMVVVRVVLCEELVSWMKCSPCLGNESMSSSATKGLSWWLVSELEVSKTMSPDLFEFLNIPSQSKNLFLNGVVLWQWGYLLTISESNLLSMFVHHM